MFCDRIMTGASYDFNLSVKKIKNDKTSFGVFANRIAISTVLCNTSYPCGSGFSERNSKSFNETAGRKHHD